MLKDLKNKIGRVFMVGIPGVSLDKDTAEFLTKLNPGGVILFSRNFESPPQFKDLIAHIKDLFDQRILVALDHEGGRIVRFNQGVTVFPGNMALGIAGNRDLAFQQGTISALELGEFGINVNLAPVLDVLTGSYNPGINIRSFGQDPDLVASLGISLIEGTQKAGVSATAKHFPGKGPASVDAHLDLPTIDLSYEMTRPHLYPFIKAIEAGVDLIMSTHLVHTSLESQRDLPATFSRSIIYNLLRKELAFNGVITTDDLEMGAIEKHYTIEEAVIRSLAAGHDMVLICSNREYQERGFNALTSAYKEDRLDVEEVEGSLRRIEALIDKGLEKRPKIEPDVSGAKLAEEIARKSVQVFRDKKGLIPIRTPEKVTVIYPDFSHLTKGIFFEKEVIEGKPLIRRFLKVGQDHMGFVKLSVENDLSSTRQLLDRLEKDSLIILFCFEAHLYPSQHHLLDLIQREFKRVIVVLLGSPMDEEFIRSDASVIATHGFRLSQLKAAINLLNP